MTKEMRELLEKSYKGDEVIEYIESLEDELAATEYVLNIFMRKEETGNDC